MHASLHRDNLKLEGGTQKTKIGLPHDEIFFLAGAGAGNRRKKHRKHRPYNADRTNVTFTNQRKNV